MNVTMEEKTRYISTPVTLNGKPAVIRGRLLSFGHVCYAKTTDAGVEFCWPTIKRIIEEKGGKFKS